MAQTGSSGTFKVGSLLLAKLGIVVAQGSGQPTDGSSGTLAGKIGLNGDYLDRSSGWIWTNIGTKASPKWSVLAQTVRVAVSSANILGMQATPVQILPAPGANRIILIDSILFTMTTTATAYANGGTVQFQYHGQGVGHTGTIPAAVVTAGAGTSQTELGPLAGANGTTLTSDVNLGIDITNNTAPFITGTGTAVVFITFGVVPTT